jgi:hypothetical protein
MGLHKVDNVLFLKGNWMRYGFTEEEVKALDELYEKSGGHPGRNEGKRLIERFGLPSKKVYNWFYGRRTRERSKNGFK